MKKSKQEQIDVLTKKLELFKLYQQSAEIKVVKAKMRVMHTQAKLDELLNS